MEIFYFHKLVLQAWASSRAKKLPWIFASLVALSSLIGSRVNTDLAGASSLRELLSIVAQKPPQELLSVFLILLILFIIGIVGKSNLIVSLSFITNKNSLPNHPNTSRAIGSNFIRSFFLECLALLFILIIIGVLCIPLLIASRTNPSVLSSLLSFGFFTFIPIAIIIFLIKQFALFYLLLSPLSIRGSIETGSFLFSRFVFLCFIFAFFSFILTLLFTFSVNLVTLGIAMLSEKISLPFGEAVISFVVSFSFLTWFSIFDQALWLAFFKSIASPRETNQVAKEKESVLDNGVLPETPPAQ